MELNNIVKFAFPDWQLALVRLAVVYRILECGEKIPLITEKTNYEFVDDVLNDMHNRGFLDISDDNMHYVVTSKGEGIRTQMVAVYDHSLKFEIFSTVNMSIELPDNITDEEGNILDHSYDPRFEALNKDKEETGETDLRIAMMIWASECVVEEDSSKSTIDPRMIVFMQMLASGKLQEKDFWFDLKAKTFFNEVEEIVNGSYEWEDVDDDEDTAWDIMEGIYTAGLLEEKKRNSFECSACGIPLGVFELNAQEDGEELTECPNPDCGASYLPPEPLSYECPKCKSTIESGQRSCSGCGAEVDFAMAEGSVSETTETVTEEETSYEDAWDYDYGYYGYSPYGYYNPYEPLVDALVFCAAVDMLYY